MSNIMDVESIRGDEYYTLDKDVETIAQHLIKPMRAWLSERGCSWTIY